MNRRIELSTFEELKNYDSYLNWLNDPEVFKYLESNSRKSSISDIQDYINLQKENGHIFLPVIYKSNGDHIGNLKIYNFNEENNLKSCEYSRVIGNKSYWGKGLGYELGLLALAYCFNILRVDIVEAGCVSSNIAAIKSNLKIGFKESHKITKFVEQKNKKEEIIRFKILRSDFT
jgi:[ribosomal protein S5]-alanine N-acetyltransferase